MTSRKLSDSDKSAILALYRQPTETTSTLASYYGVSKTTISGILNSRLSDQEYETLVKPKRLADSDDIAALPQEISYSVAHAIPGRIRFHIPRLATDPEYAHKLKVVTEFAPRITHVRLDPAAASIIINYQPGVISDDQMQSHLVSLIQTAPDAVVPTEATAELTLGAIFDALVTPIDSVPSMDNVRNVIMHRFAPDALKPLIYSENHKARLPQAIAPAHSDTFFAQKRSSLGAVLIFTLPGIPISFQEQEFVDGARRDDVPLNWPKLLAHSELHDLYRDLIRLRLNWYKNTRGLRGQNVHVHHVNENDKVMAFHRWENGGPGDDVVVVLNMGNRAYDSYSIGLPRGGMWWVRFNSDWSGYSPNFGNHPGHHTIAGWTDAGDPDHMPYRGNLGIGRYTALILSQ